MLMVMFSGDQMNLPQKKEHKGVMVMLQCEQRPTLKRSQQIVQLSWNVGGVGDVRGWVMVRKGCFLDVQGKGF